MSMSTLQVLKRARERIAEPRNWLKGDFRGRNDFGEPTYCALGALGFTSKKVPQQAADAAEVLVSFIPSACWGIAEWNDDWETTHEQVLAVFDKAIEELS